MATSRTAAYVALYRALESDETAREPLFRDPYARRFLPPSLAFLLSLARFAPLRSALVRYSDWRAPGARSSAIGRTRYIDDLLRKSLAEGVAQLVVLGAGYDARAHRLPELRGVPVFEVDRAATQANKRALVGATAGVRYVAHDFGAGGDVMAELTAAGLDAAAPAFFILEGVSNYLDEPAMARLLGAIGQSAPGSVLVFTYIHRGVLEDATRFEGAEKIVANVARLGEPWRFGLDPAELPAFIGRFAMRLEEDLGADAYRRRYLGGDHLRGYAFYRIAVARVSSGHEPA